MRGYPLLVLQIAPSTLTQAALVLRDPPSLIMGDSPTPTTPIVDRYELIILPHSTITIPQLLAETSRCKDWEWVAGRVRDREKSTGYGPLVVNSDGTAYSGAADIVSMAS